MNRHTSVIFDVDSTLVTIEGLVALANKKGLNGEIAAITEAGMNGELSFRESVHRRLEAIRPTLAELQWLGDWYVQHLTQGVTEVCAELHKRGTDVYIISGSYRPALTVLAHTLGIPNEHVFALELTFDREGQYQGYASDQLLLHDDGKLRVLQELAPPRSIAFVGDGVTDLATRRYVDCFVGFGGVRTHHRVKAEADIFVHEPDLRRVLQWI